MNFQIILDCYRSGQMSERQWAAHCADEMFAAWLRRQQASRRTNQALE